MILQVPPSRDKKNTPREVQPGDELVEAEVDKNGNRDSHTGGVFSHFWAPHQAMWRPGV